MGRFCKSCGEYKEAAFFTPFKGGRNGLYPHCKACRVDRAKEQWKQKSYKKKIYDRCKTRAKQKGFEFTIELEDIIIPSLCPVFAVEMVGKYAPSLDRIDSSKGYVKGNVQVISTRANILKNNATAEELRKVADFISIGEVNDG